MYQMFVGCRIIAEGRPLLGIDKVTIRKDLQIPGETVDSYALRPRQASGPIIERKLPLGTLGRLVVDSIEPYVSTAERHKLTAKIFWQILMFTYPFWIFEYRRVQSWRYALGICLGMRPRNLLAGIELPWKLKSWLSILYFFVSLCGLTAPVKLFSALQPRLYSIAKAFR
jgi:hypothetical protein